MSYYVDIQHTAKIIMPVSDETIISWVTSTLKPYKKKAEITLRFVEPSEIMNLNNLYRQQNKPTNVLAFKADYPKNIKLKYPLLGDLVICPQILSKESEELNVDLKAHWAHIIIHGILHLLGYDHINEEDFEVMHKLEIKFLEQLGFNNPYNKKGNDFE